MAKVNPDTYAVAAEAIGQMFTMAKVDMTPIESNLWTRELARLGPERILSFVEFWVSGGVQTPYRRAPKIDDLLVRADPNYVNAETALVRLREAVRVTGPYGDPNIRDAKLQTAVAALGGWSQVCQEMPDEANDFACKRFEDKLKAAWLHSESKLVQQTLVETSLLGLCAAQTVTIETLSSQRSGH